MASAKESKKTSKKKQGFEYPRLFEYQQLRVNTLHGMFYRIGHVATLLLLGPGWLAAVATYRSRCYRKRPYPRNNKNASSGLPIMLDW